MVEGFKDLKDIFTMPINEENHDKTLDINYKLRIRKKQVLTDREKELKIKGRKIKLVVPKNIENGQVILLQEEGKKKGNKYGNVYITVELLNF